MYSIQKQGMWLLSYMKTVAIRSDTLYVCLWGDQEQDAMVFENRVAAENMCDKIGGELVPVKTRDQGKGRKKRR